MESVERIIANAQDSIYKGQSAYTRYRLYSSFKRDIERLELESTDYTRAIRRLADALEV